MMNNNTINEKMITRSMNAIAAYTNENIDDMMMMSAKLEDGNLLNITAMSEWKNYEAYVDVMTGDVLGCLSEPRDCQIDTDELDLVSNYIAS